MDDVLERVHNAAVNFANYIHENTTKYDLDMLVALTFSDMDQIIQSAENKYEAILYLSVFPLYKLSYDEIKQILDKCDISGLAEKFIVLLAEKEKTDDTLKRFKQQFYSLNENFKVSKEGLDQLATKNEQYKSEIVRLKTIIETNERELTELKKFNTSYIEMNTNHEQKIKEKDAKIINLNRNNEECRNLVNRAGIELKNITEERNNLINHLNSLVEERDNLIDQRNVLLDEKDNLTEERDSLTIERDNLSKQNDKLKEMIDKQNDYIEELESQKEDLELAKDDLEERVEKQKNVIKKKNLERAKLIEKYDTYRENIREEIYKNAEIEDDLFIAAKEGNIISVKKIIREDKGKVNETNQYGDTALHEAAANGHNEIVNYLIKHKADVNQTNMFGCTPLHNAVKFGKLNVIESLIENGAKDIPDKNGKTCIHSAALTGNSEAIKMLAENEFDVTKKDKKGKTPLYYAIVSEATEAVEELVENNALDSFTNEKIEKLKDLTEDEDIKALLTK